jgi:hypothetical protein
VKPSSTGSVNKALPGGEEKLSKNAPHGVGQSSSNPFGKKILLTAFHAREILHAEKHPFANIFSAEALSFRAKETKKF